MPDNGGNPGDGIAGVDGEPIIPDSATGAADSGGSGTPGGTEFTNPDGATGANTDGSGVSGTTRRGRGRPRGSTNKSSTGQTSPFRAIGADGVASLLAAVHAALATVAKCPELNISDDEAQKLAKAAIGVAKLYDIKASEKAIAWSALIAVCGEVYVTRAFAISVRVKTAEKDRPPVNGGTAPFGYTVSPTSTRAGQ